MVTFAGPLTAGTFMPPGCVAPFDLAGNGYLEQEFLVSGSARTYARVTSAGGGGVTQAGGSARFRTRIVVRRPEDPGRFSGTLLLEWLNVSSGFETDPDWAYLHEEIFRAGHAYAAVSTQAISVHGGRGGFGFSVPFPGLRAADRVRYGSLRHPGDQYSFDIFRQIGRALGPAAAPGGAAEPGPGARRVLGRLVPARVLALGESRSAYFLTSYINVVQPLAPVFDGFLVHSRGAGAAPLTGAAFDPLADVKGVRIRAVDAAPVLVLQAEGDLVRPLASVRSRQPDSDRFRLWEAAGTAHTDAYLVGPASDLLGVGWRLNEGPHRYIAQAALHALHCWARDGTPAPRAARIELASRRPLAIKRDTAGNAVGGVRTPPVDVPVAALSGEGPPGADGPGWLVGSTSPFDGAELVRRYRDKDGYIGAFTRSLDAAIAAGFLLPAHREQLLAEAADVTWPT